MRAIVVVVLALVASSLAGGCAGSKGEYYRLTTRTTQDGCCPPHVEKEEIYAIGDPRVVGVQAPVLDRGYAALSSGGSDAAAANAAALSDFFGGGSARSVRLDGPQKYFRPFQEQGVRGYRYTPRKK